MGPAVRMISGFRLLGAVTLGLLLMATVVLAIAGTDEPGVRMLVRATARSSVLLFLCAFTASGLYRLRPGTATAWLLRNRRHLGLSFAVSHAIHLAAVATLFLRWPHPYPVPTAIGGGLGYLFLAAMTITSFDRTTAWLGARNWKRLHLAGSFYLWGIFFFSYLPRALFESVGYLPLALLVLSAPVIRLVPRPRVATT